MGNRLTEEEESGRSDTPYGDIFDELFPQYLAIGMTPEEYWDGEVGLKPAYREAYRIRTENERRTADWERWLQGLYIRDALQSVALFVGGLNTKGITLPEYPDKPRLEIAEEQKKEEVRRKEQEDQMKLAMAMFQARISQFNKRFEERKAAEQQAVSSGQ